MPSKPQTALDLWFPVLALFCFGVLFVYSASSVTAQARYGREFFFVHRQLVTFAVGAGAAWAGYRVPFALWMRLSPWALGAALILVAATLHPQLGHRVGGASRWLRLGVATCQPAEFLKLALVLFLSRTLGGTRDRTGLALGAVGASLFLLLLQPDFGTSLIILCTVLGMFFVSGTPLRYFLGSACLCLLGAAAICLAAPYRLRRLLAFLDPFASPLGSGFQIIQSFIAIRNGGFLGKGLGSSQQKLFFLPEAHTDFILSVVSEEMGLVGITALAMLFYLLFAALVRLAQTARPPAQKLLAAGLFQSLSASTLMNMAVVSGLVPTKGLPLPFLSSGGTALVSTCFLLGIATGFLPHCRAPKT